MRKMRSKFTSLLVVAMILTMMLSSVSVYAEVDADIKTALSESATSTLEEIFAYDDATIAELQEADGVASVVGDALAENMPVVGEYVSVNEVTVDDSDDDAVTVNADVSFDKYDAEIVMYFDTESYSLTNFEMNVDYPLGEKMKQAAQNTVVGLGIVFVVLFFLLFVISMFKYVSLIDPEARKKANAKKAAPAAKAAPAPKAAPKAAPAAAPAAADDSDDEIVAVIAAAIAAAQADAPSDTGYVVRSVRRTGTARRWKRG